MIGTMEKNTQQGKRKMEVYSRQEGRRGVAMVYAVAWEGLFERYT